MNVCFSILISNILAQGRRLFFDDGMRRIDFILAWKAKKKNLDDTKNTDSAQEIQVTE